MSLDAALQKAVYDTLLADTALAVEMGGAVRVYDSVPDNAIFPYLSIGSDQIVDNGTSCSNGSEAFVEVHVWSRAVGRVEAKKISGAVRAALDMPLVITGHKVIVHGFQDARHLNDPDGITAHSVVSFRYLTEEAAP